MEERVALTAAWDFAADKVAEARRQLAAAEKHLEQVARVYDEHADALGAFLAKKSAEKTGAAVPDGRRGVEFRGHLIHRNRVFVVASGCLRADADGVSTNRVGYTFSDVGGSVFDAESGVHSFPAQG
jgi:hypothetical protein